MIRLSAFADEIAADLDEQIAVLREEQIRYLELRGVWGLNVLDLDDAQVARIKQTLGANGIAVSAIGSPIGKTPLDAPFDQHLQRFERAITLAQTFQTPYIRIFSFYPPAATAAGQEIDWMAHRAEVLARLREMTARARAAGVTLLHENEHNIYGESIDRCVDLLRGIDDAHFQATFDPANFIYGRQRPYPHAYEALRPWIRYVHVKDARPGGGVVVAGAGAARWPELLQRLRADGYDGFFALEPHLAAAGQYQGFSGPTRFREAAHALQSLLHTMEWSYQ